MTTLTNYDAIIIGAGQAGVPLPTTLARAGWKIALVERLHVGGTCVNEGCTPTKTMVASARVAYLAKRAADYGVHTGPRTIDMVKVRERKRNIVNDFRSTAERRIENTEGVDLLMGEAHFIGPKTIEMRLNSSETRWLRANTIFLNVGARPAVPPLSGLDLVNALNSTTIMELAVVPEHLLIIGGGYVGLEFSQMFRRFGSRVTIVQRRGQVLTREDADVSDEIANILREDGIELLLNTHPVRVEQSTTDNILLGVQGPDGEHTVHGSHLLIATGRVPNSDWLNLEAAGVEMDSKGFIKVDERLETNVPGIYALGDVKGGPAFTHISYDDFRIIRTNLLEDGHATTRGRFVPYTIFIDPQLGRVGMSEAEARAQGHYIRVAKMPMNYVARALEVDETRGFMKAVVDADTSQILGCAILGIAGGEIMSVLQVAMMGKVPYPVLREGTFAHPTLSESLNNLFYSFEE